MKWRQDLPGLRRRVYLPPLVAATLLLAAPVADILHNHRRVVRFRAAWAFDMQHEHCRRLAAAHAREAAQAEAEAERRPEGSTEREVYRREARAASSLAAAEWGVAGQARATAEDLRRRARTPP